MALQKAQSLQRSHRAVYSFIKSYVRRNKISPTMREIESALGRSRGSVQNSLKRLESKGYIRSQKGKSRSIIVVQSEATRSRSRAKASRERPVPSIARSITKPVAKSIAEPILRSVPVAKDSLSAQIKPATDSFPSPSISSSSTGLPIRGEIAAGFCHDPFTEVNESFNFDNCYASSDYVLKVSGDSMIDAGILDGSYVGIKAVPDGYRPSPGQIVAVWVEGQGTTLKHFYQKGSMVFLEAANSKYPPMIFDLETCHLKIQGVYVFTWHGAA